MKALSPFVIISKDISFDNNMLKISETFWVITVLLVFFSVLFESEVDE